METLELGQILITSGICADMERSPEFVREVIQSLLAHHKLEYDKTTLDEQDIMINLNALKTGRRILTRFNTCKGVIYIITEWDRSCTTILYTYEY